ncbi:hypothetical protein ACLOJK_029025 [Asimina triloba]
MEMLVFSTAAKEVATGTFMGKIGTGYTLCLVCLLRFANGFRCIQKHCLSSTYEWRMWQEALQLREILSSVGDDEDSVTEQAITALKKGAYLLKYGRRGKPKFCPFRLSNGSDPVRPASRSPP